MIEHYCLPLFCSFFPCRYSINRKNQFHIGIEYCCLWKYLSVLLKLLELLISFVNLRYIIIGVSSNKDDLLLKNVWLMSSVLYIDCPSTKVRATFVWRANTSFFSFFSSYSPFVQRDRRANNKKIEQQTAPLLRCILFSLFFFFSAKKARSSLYLLCQREEKRKILLPFSQPVTTVTTLLFEPINHSHSFYIEPICEKKNIYTYKWQQAIHHRLLYNVIRQKRDAKIGE